MPKQEINTIARIENTLIFHAEYQLTAKEQKVMLYLISSIDPVSQNRIENESSNRRGEGRYFGHLVSKKENLRARRPLRNGHGTLTGS